MAMLHPQVSFPAEDALSVYRMIHLLAPSLFLYLYSYEYHTSLIIYELASTVPWTCVGRQMRNIPQRTWNGKSRKKNPFNHFLLNYSTGPCARVYGYFGLSNTRALLGCCSSRSYSCLRTCARPFVTSKAVLTSHHSNFLIWFSPDINSTHRNGGSPDLCQPLSTGTCTIQVSYFWRRGLDIT